MVNKRCAYDVLGVPRNADEEALKKAYKKMALKWHPDRHVNDDEAEQKAAEEKFKEAAGAFEVLNDKQTRAAYDAYGWAGLEGGAPPPSSNCAGGGMPPGFGGGFPGGAQHFVFRSNGGGGGGGFSGNVDPMKLFASLFGDEMGMGAGGMGGMGVGGMPSGFAEAGMGRSSFDSMFGGHAHGNPKKRGRPASLGVLAPGAQVVAHGLQSASAEEVNGTMGTVVSDRTANGRYTVEFAGLRKSLALRRSNLLQVGVSVRLSGLKSQPQLNGATGRLVGMRKDRYLVQLAQTTAAFRRECVELPVGTAVVVGGLASRPELNGESGEVVELDRAAGRFVVSLESGTSVKLKPENLTC